MSIIKLGDINSKVREIQIVLSGFNGTVWDGIFGPNTERQVKQFQKDYMNVYPDGVVGDKTFEAIEKFNDEYKVDFIDLRCPCGHCNGFGNGLYQGEYNNSHKIERYHMYEYPGIHKVILWTSKAFRFYIKKIYGYDCVYSSGYRCSINNKQKGRTSTNHCGKAIDLDIVHSGDKRQDMIICDNSRKKISTLSNIQIGWNDFNVKSFEPSYIAPTWIHMDVRCYDRRYLQDEFFIQY